MNDYKVSVIVPVHNTEQYLEECVESICNQKLHDIEILLVENASSDGSLQLCHSLAAKDDRIKVFHLDTGDLSTARNYGVDNAKGDFVAFVDSDDVLEPDMYSDMYELAAKDGLQCVVCNYARYRKANEIKYQYLEDGSFRVMDPKELVRLNLMEKVSQSACTMLLSVELAKRNPFPPFQYFEDRITTYRFIADSQKCGYIARSYYRYLQYRGSIRNSKSFKRNYDFALADRSRLKFINESSMFSNEDRSLVAEKAAESFLRKLNRIRSAISSEEERRLYNELKRSASLIPAGTSLSLKARIIRYFVNQSSVCGV